MPRVARIEDVMSTFIRGFGLAVLAGTMGFASAPLPQPAPAATGTAWDTTLARGATRTIDFTTDVGTWVSVDLSPDGRWIVFDLLSHIYRVPAAGGEAECLTQDSGVALNYHPRYSPDGTAI